MPRVMLTLVALGLFLGMTLWFSATAAAPAIAAEFSITGAGLAWLTMAVQGGFVAGTLVSALLNLADVVNARHLFAWGCLAGAIANAAIPFAPSGAVIVLLRTATGVALAFVYPPGLKIAAGWFLNRRGTALGIVVGALTLGSAFPHLMAWAAADVPWRSMLWVSSALAIAGGAIVALGVRDGPYVSASAPFDPRAVGQVVSNRGVRLATLGYLGHMWELYAMWAWMPAFAAASIAAAAAEERQRRNQLARCVCRNRQRCGGLRDGRSHRRRLGKGENCRRGDGRQRLLRARGRLRLRTAPARAADIRRLLGILDRRRFGAILCARRRTQSTDACRHGAHASDLSRIPVDDDQHAAAAGRRIGNRVAVGVSLARPGPRPGGCGNAALAVSRAARGMVLRVS